MQKQVSLTGKNALDNAQNFAGVPPVPHPTS
jgi:hypothetical protein